MASAAPKSFKIFYMNQGGGGNWGAIRYSEYDLLCIAEWHGAKEHFEEAWISKSSVPTMSIQVSKTTRGDIRNLLDSDLTSSTVRPIVTFTIKGQAFRVVFLHLKSGNEKEASLALGKTISNLDTLLIGNSVPTLWIGDFNRAKGLTQFIKEATAVIVGGGQSEWDLDRVYTSGTWPKELTVTADRVSTAGDNAHAGYAITVNNSKRA